MSSSLDGVDFTTSYEEEEPKSVLVERLFRFYEDNHGDFTAQEQMVLEEFINQIQVPGYLSGIGSVDFSNEITRQLDLIKSIPGFTVTDKAKFMESLQQAVIASDQGGLESAPVSETYIPEFYDQRSCIRVSDY